MVIKNKPTDCRADLTGVGVLGALGCNIASTVFKRKAFSAINKSDIDYAKKYSKLSQQLEYASWGAAVPAIVGSGIAFAGNIDKFFPN